MKTVKQLSEETGVPYATIQFWKRTGGLLPAPVGQDGRNALYDDSTSARIRNIVNYQKDGMSLEKIAELLRLQEEIKKARIEKAENIEMKRDFEEYAKKWTKGDCKGEICNLLELDPVFAGNPSCFPMVKDDLDSNAGISPSYVLVTIVSGENVHIAKIVVDVYTQPTLVARYTMSKKVYGMVYYILLQGNSNIIPDHAIISVAIFEDGKFDVLVKAAEACLYFLEYGKRVVELAVNKQN